MSTRHRYVITRSSWPPTISAVERAPEVRLVHRRPVETNRIEIRTSHRADRRARIELPDSQRSLPAGCRDRSPFEDRVVMSPPNSPPVKARTFVPLPDPLPVKKEELPSWSPTSSSPLVFNHGHKTRHSQDSGFASLTASVENLILKDRQATPAQNEARTEDSTAYEEIIGHQGSEKLYLINGKVYRRVSRRQKPSPEPREKSALVPYEQTYKEKYERVKATARSLEAVVAETMEANDHNYDAAKREESKNKALLTQVSLLRQQLKEAEARAVAARQDLAKEHQRWKRDADRKAEERERAADAALREADRDREKLQAQLQAQLRDLDELEDFQLFSKQQNQEIAASPTLMEPRRPKLATQRRPVQLNQDDRVASMRASDLNGAVFTDPLDEARDDYEKSRSRRQRPVGEDKEYRSRDSRRHK